MNIFQKIISAENQADVRLGYRAKNQAAYDRRLNIMARVSETRPAKYMHAVARFRSQPQALAA